MEEEKNSYVNGEQIEKNYDRKDCGVTKLTLRYVSTLHTTQL